MHVRTEILKTCAFFTPPLPLPSSVGTGASCMENAHSIGKYWNRLFFYRLTSGAWVFYFTPFCVGFYLSMTMTHTICIGRYKWVLFTIKVLPIRFKWLNILLGYSPWIGLSWLNEHRNWKTPLFFDLREHSLIFLTLRIGPGWGKGRRGRVGEREPATTPCSKLGAYTKQVNRILVC